MKPPHVGWLLIAVAAVSVMLGAVLAGADHRWAARKGAEAACGTVALDYAVFQARYDSLVRDWQRQRKLP